VVSRGSASGKPSVPTPVTSHAVIRHDGLPNEHPIVERYGTLTTKVNVAAAGVFDVSSFTSIACV
jgi:hypothetical protein